MAAFSSFSCCKSWNIIIIISFKLIPPLTPKARADWSPHRHHASAIFFGAQERPPPPPNLPAPGSRAEPRLASLRGREPTSWRGPAPLCRPLPRRPGGRPGSRALRGGKRSSAGRHLVGGGAGPGPPRALPVGAAPAPPHSPLPTERSGARRSRRCSRQRHWRQLWQVSSSSSSSSCPRGRGAAGRPGEAAPRAPPPWRLPLSRAGVSAVVCRPLSPPSRSPAGTSLRILSRRPAEARLFPPAGEGLPGSLHHVAGLRFTLAWQLLPLPCHPRPPLLRPSFSALSPSRFCLAAFPASSPCGAGAGGRYLVARPGRRAPEVGGHLRREPPARRPGAGPGLGAAFAVPRRSSHVLRFFFFFLKRNVW